MSNVVPNRFIQVDICFPTEKKNTVRYDADLDQEKSRAATVGNIYIKKTALAAAFGHFPSKGVRVTIEELV